MAMGVNTYSGFWPPALVFRNREFPMSCQCSTVKYEWEVGRRMGGARKNRMMAEVQRKMVTGNTSNSRLRPMTANELFSNSQLRWNLFIMTCLSDYAFRCRHNG